MPRPHLMLAAALLFSLASAAEDYAPRLLTPQQAQADIALLRRALETIHPGLYRYRTRQEIDAALMRLESAGGAPITDIALWRETALALAEIHCDHTKAEIPDRLEEYRANHATHLPIRFKIVEGRMIVLSSSAQPEAPPFGAEITAINGRPVPEILETLGKAVSYDGATEQAIAAKLSSDSDLEGDDFNEYWPAFFGFPDHWQLDWKKRGDLTTTRSLLAPVTFRDWAALPWPGSRYREEFYHGIVWRLAGRTAYLRIDSFVNYRNPVDATGFLGGFFESLQKSGADHLILDLRHNGGGSVDASVALGRYLLPTGALWSKPPLLKAVRYGDLPDHIQSWGDRTALFQPDLAGFRRHADGWWERLPKAGDPDDEDLFPLVAAKSRFTGALSVLIGPQNGSGATRTIAQLKEKTAAQLIGEDSSGSAEGPTAGHIFLLTLPNSGIKVRIPNAWNRTAIDHFAVGRGVPADRLVIETIADLRAGTDQVLDVAKSKATPLAPQLFSALSGPWSGTLNYRDFGNDRRVILPTEMTTGSEDDAVRLGFTYDDGPGKTVRSDERWMLSADGAVLTVDEDRFDVTELIGGSAPNDVTLVAGGRGEDNGQAVEVRIVVTRRGGDLSLSRLTRRPGGPFIARHAYELTLKNR